MKYITALLLISLTSCSGHFGWGTHKISVDADELDEKVEQKNG